MIKEVHDRYKNNVVKISNDEGVQENSGRTWVQNGYVDTSGSSGNTSNSPTYVDGIASDYRTEGEKLALSTTNFIETPVYTFILPDLTIYPGNFTTVHIFRHNIYKMLSANFIMHIGTNTTCK